MSSKLAQLVESSRWRPYLLGGLASLPVTGLMLLVWKYYHDWAIGWLVLYAFLGGLGVFWKTPARKLISTAVMFGTVVPFLIVFAR